MDSFKNYTVKSKDTKLIWVFKYHLEGELSSFEILNGTFDEKQSNWLFIGGRFPFTETIMKKFIESFSKYFTFEVNLPEITFDFFYSNYGKKRTRAEALKYWNKNMKPDQHILAVMGMRTYRNICKLDNKSAVDPIRYLRNERYLDEY
jgi:hypothetical protein